MGRLNPKEMRRWLDRDGYREIKTFVETGTELGKSTRWMAEVFDRCITVEGSSVLFHLAGRLLARFPNVTSIKGDSAKLLPGLADELTEPVVWFLDSHYYDRRGEPAFDGTRVPLLSELRAIASRPYPDIIIIDDIRFFGQKKRAMDWVGITRAKVLEIIGEETVVHTDITRKRWVIYRTKRAGS